MKKGYVSLVGAGPGDYKLISLKGCEAIAKADVIVYDRLADDRLLAHAKNGVELVYVGKQSREHTMQQEDISQLLVDKAKAGKYVVRLKGGDPFVFGRGGEEALLLKENNIAFEIIPGITSAISVPAYAGIPVTQRDMAVSFAVVTGHENPEKENTGVNWEKLATAVDTLVFLMGVENLPMITSKLMQYGRSADTPAAVIRWGTKTEQKTLVTSLGDAVADVQKHSLKPPAVFVVGEVVTLREQLAWFDKKPLFGKKILVTRAREQASSLVELLESKGAHCIQAPMIKIAPPDEYKQIDESIASLNKYDFVIFTSANSVQQFMERVLFKGSDSRSFAGIKIASIGQATTESLRKYGLVADLTAKEATAEGLIKTLDGKALRDKKILLPRAQKAREVLPDWLREQGAQVDVLPVYQTIIGDADAGSLKKALANSEIDIVTFTSASTVNNLLCMLGSEGEALLAKTATACIGPITATACKDKGLEPALVVTTATISDFAQAIEDYLGGTKDV